MKDLNLVSRVNGLQVAVPASAMPSPSCDGVMCEKQLEQTASCEIALAASPAGVRQAQRFQLVFEAIEGQVIAEMAGGSWSAGDAPAGLPANYVALQAGNNGDGDGYFLIDVNCCVSSVAPPPEVTITAPDGTEVFNGLITYQGSGVFSVTLDQPLGVEGGVVYCVTVETTGAIIA